MKGKLIAAGVGAFQAFIIGGLLYEAVGVFDWSVAAYGVIVWAFGGVMFYKLAGDVL